MSTVQFAISKARLVNSLLQPKPGEEPLTILPIEVFCNDIHRAVSNNAYVAIKVASVWLYVRGSGLTSLESRPSSSLPNTSPNTPIALPC